MQFLKEQKGSALIYVLICSLLLTSTLLVILNHYQLQQRLIHRKGHLLQAKYSAEGAIYQILEQMEKNWEAIPQEKNGLRVTALSEADSARVNYRCWGGFILLSSVAKKKKETFCLESTIGAYPSNAFAAALVLTPKPSPLVLTGGSRIQGDVIMGMGGIRKGLSGIHEYEADEMVTGRVIGTHTDLRPEIDRNYLKNLWQIFQEMIASDDLPTFPEIMRDSTHYFSADSATNWWKQPIRLTNEQLNEKNWQLHGPLTLIADEPLILKNNLIMEHYVQLISNRSILIQGKCSTYHKVLVYSPEKIILSEVDNFCGQIFSNQAIVIENNSRLHYPTLLMVWSDSDSSFIQIDASSSMVGSVILVSEIDSAVRLQNQAKIFIEKGAVVNGLVWSDNYTQLNGEVDGLVITDQFYEYQSPTIYLNWIRDGIIRRERLNSRFRLPLFFKQTGLHLSPMDLQ
jgi:hypothetical protein